MDRALTDSAAARSHVMAEPPVAPWRAEMRAHMDEDNCLHPSFFLQPGGSAEPSDVVRAYGRLEPDGLPGPETVPVFLPYRVQTLSRFTDDVITVAERMDQFRKWLSETSTGAWMVLVDAGSVYFVFEEPEDATVFTLLFAST